MPRVEEFLSGLLSGDSLQAAIVLKEDVFGGRMPNLDACIDGAPTAEDLTWRTALTIVFALLTMLSMSHVEIAH
jgi:hypothetical protein